jgi:hypothetical protein
MNIIPSYFKLSIFYINNNKKPVETFEVETISKPLTQQARNYTWQHALTFNNVQLFLLNNVFYGTYSNHTDILGYTHTHIYIYIYIYLFIYLFI